MSNDFLRYKSPSLPLSSGVPAEGARMPIATSVRYTWSKSARQAMLCIAAYDA